MALSPLALRLAIAGALVLPFHATASSLYVGYSQSEQLTPLADRTLEFNADGLSALAIIDINDELSVTASASALDDEINITQQVTGDLDIDTWGVGLSYVYGDWLMSFNVADWQDALRVDARVRDPRRFDQSTDSTSFSVSAGYGWAGLDWHSGITFGVHYNDWTTSEIMLRPDAPPTSLVDEGTSTFLSLNLSASRFLFTQGEQSLALGGVLSWNQLTDDSSNAISRNGRNISQLNNRRLQDRLNQTAVVGTESYGQGTVYLSYSVNAHWMLDVDVTSDIGSDENTTAWSVNLGYTF